MPRKKKSAPVRGMWTGTISFGLVSVPVSLFPALRPRPVRLRRLADDGTPLRRQYFCPVDGRALDQDDLVRGYEMDDGKMVIVEDRELEALEPEKSNDISLKEFVDVKEIPALLFDRPYFLVPAGGSSKAYRLLASVMEEQGRAGIASFVMRDKEYLVAILAEKGLLMAETLRFADEIRDVAEIGPAPKGEVDSKLVQGLKRSIASLSREALSQKELEDRYSRRFETLVKRKRKSPKAVVRKEAAAAEEEDKIIDLVALFKERMREAEEAEGKRGRRAKAA